MPDYQWLIQPTEAVNLRCARAPDSAVRTGRRTAGMFFAASSFMQQGSSGLGIFAADRSKHEANLSRLRALEAEARAKAVEDSPLGAPLR